MHHATFPVLPVQEVLSILNDGNWKLGITQDQLLRPTPESVERLYLEILYKITGMEPNAIQSSVQSALMESEDRDWYSSGLTSSVLVSHVQRLARAARIDDFSALDIYRPERERTVTIVSGFINFIKFIEECCYNNAEQIQKRSDAIRTERENVMDQLGSVQQQIDTIRKKQAQDEPQTEKYREENRALRDKMIATKELQMGTAQEVEQLREQKSTLIKRREALQTELAAVSDAANRDRSRIVRSPERVKNSIHLMTNAVQADKQTIAQQDNKTRELQQKIDALLAIERDVRGCVEQLQTVGKEVEMLQNSQKELADLRDHLEGKNVERSELSVRKERVSVQLSNAKEKLERAQRHAVEKKASSQRTIERLQREYEDMALERRDNDKQVEELRAEADEIDAKMAEHVKTSETELNELLAEYWKLRHETDVYMETIAKKLKLQVSLA